MTDAQSAFLAKVKEYEAMKDKYLELKEELTGLMNTIPVGTLFQDQETSLVYKITVPDGKYMYFDKIDYVRTKKADERQGSLSKKEAEEAGFILSK